MAKKPVVYTNGPPEQGRHYIDAREHAQTFRCAITFKKGIGPEHYETFRKQMTELVETMIAMDRGLDERGLKRRPPEERWKDRSGSRARCVCRHNQSSRNQIPPKGESS